MHVPLQSNLSGHRPEAPAPSPRKSAPESPCAENDRYPETDSPPGSLLRGPDRPPGPSALPRRPENPAVGAKSRLLQPRGNLKDARALRNGHRLGKNIAARDARIDLNDRSRMVEAILAGLERSPLPPAHQIKGILAAHHARRFQLPPNLYRGRARRQLDKGLPLRPVWQKNQPGQRARRNRQKREDNQRPQDSLSARDPFPSSRPFARRHSLLLTLPRD